MKRLAVLLVAVSLVVVGFGFGVVQAKSARSGLETKRGTTMFSASRSSRMELRRIRAMAPGVTPCSDITANSDVNKLIDCLNRVTKFAKATQRELDGLDRFVSKFFRCTTYGPFILRGVQPGTAGYFFDQGDGTIVKMSAVDLSPQLETGTFLTYNLRPTEACLKFAKVI